MSNARALRYRKLALAEKDKAIADLLLKLADECDRAFSARLNGRLPRKNEQPPRAEDAKLRFEWDPLNDQR